VDNAQGRIGKWKPGDPGYAAAALARRHRMIVAPGQGAGLQRTLRLPSGRFFGFYLVSNASRHVVLASNRGNRRGDVPNVLFSLVRANPDRLDHVLRLPAGLFGFEDEVGGGDRDFRDLVLRIHFGKPQGTPTAVGTVGSTGPARSPVRLIPPAAPEALL